MDYVVHPLPNVTVELAQAERSLQDQFQEICSVIAMNPYPNPQFPLLTEDRAADGSTVYTYSDWRFPYAIHYVIFEGDEDNYGYISVIGLSAIRRRRGRPSTTRD